MLSRSLYVAGADGVIAALADALGVQPENRFANDRYETDYSFFTREENSLFFWNIEGDFQFSVDINLFHIEPPDLERSLLAVARHGVVIAMPDEDSANPFDYLLFEAGTRRAAVIIEEDDTDQVRIARKA